MFCVKCGKEAKVENFCEKCFLGRQKLFDVKDFTLIYCGLCGIKQEDIKDEIRRKIKSEHSITKASVAMKVVGNKVHAIVECEGKIEGLTKNEQKRMLVILRKKMCDAHVKLSGGYYEAKLQIRGEDKEAILRKAQRLLPTKAIVDIIELKEGYDIKVMRKSNAAEAAKALRKNYTIKVSYKLVGSKKGQMLYRNFYAIR
jgi:NMD protein affecting ribosome stability and mRNA decay